MVVPRIGLSPQVRGNRPPDIPSEPLAGSIPAGAGEPGGLAENQSPNEVYPRRCGGTDRESLGEFRQHGLSPQVRGNLERLEERPAEDRSIPAGAGEPFGAPPEPEQTRVYPRRCGGTGRGAFLAGCAWGLSPQVRGNHSPTGDSVLDERSIPAGAGEPHPVHHERG